MSEPIILISAIYAFSFLADWTTADHVGVFPPEQARAATGQQGQSMQTVCVRKEPLSTCLDIQVPDRTAVLPC